MALAPIFKKAYWSLAGLGLLYVLFLCCLINTNIQRFALYAHKFNTAKWQDLDTPEKWGFLHKQISPLNITSSDNETLYGWHVLPMNAYAQNEEAILAEDEGVRRTSSLALELLRDPSSWLVVSFHGNAGHVGQGWRTDAYRNFQAGAPDRIHVLAFDYRGFGRSTGYPTEQGLIQDGIAAVDWALHVAGVPSGRILLAGQSLGTAVATAVAEHYALKNVDFAGLMLMAPFTSIPELILTYSIRGFIPILSALRPYPQLQNFFRGRVADTWRTDRRLANWIKHSQNTNLAIFHAKDDFDIPWIHSNGLFIAAVNATRGTEAGYSIQEINEQKAMTELGEAGWKYEWTVKNRLGFSGRTITQTVIRRGGHNRIMTYAAVAKTVLELFESGTRRSGAQAGRPEWDTVD